MRINNDIVVIRYSALGDIFLAIPTVKYLLKSGYNAHWIIHEKWKDIMYYLPAKVYIYNGFLTIPRLWKELNNIKPVGILDLQNKFSSKLLTLLFYNIPFRVYTKRSLREQVRVFLNMYPFKFSYSKPVFVKYFEVANQLISFLNTNKLNYDRLSKSCTSLELFKNFLNEIDYKISIPPNFTLRAEEFLREIGIKVKEYIIIHPYASYLGKEMPIDCLNYFSNLPWPLIVIGNSNSNLKFRLWLDKIKFRQNVVDLTNSTPLYLLPAIIALSKGVISTDSAPMHIAATLKIPTVGIYFQTDPTLGFIPIIRGLYRDLNCLIKNDIEEFENVLIISKSLDCKPCSIHGQRIKCIRKDSEWECKRLNWEEVVSNVRNFFDRF